MTKFIADPDNIWTTMPQQTMTFAGFHAQSRHHEAAAEFVEGHVHAGMPRTRGHLSWPLKAPAAH